MTSEFQSMPEVTSNTPTASVSAKQSGHSSPWLWVPSLYFAQGLPYAIVVNLMVIVYKTMGWSNARVALLTSILYVPWILKPLWSPALEFIATKRLLLIGTQVIKALLFCAVVFSFSSSLVLVNIVCLLLLAFFSATYDVVSDGAYLINLPLREQAYFVGVRSISYQLARFFVMGAMVMLFGMLSRIYSIQLSWQIVFSGFAVITFLLALHHWWWVPEKEAPISLSWGTLVHALVSIKTVLKAFVQLPRLMTFLLFLFFYNAAAAQLMKMVPLFMLDSVANGGLGLKPYVVGWLDGGLGLGAMIAGSTIAGILLARFGAKSCLVIMTVLMGLGTIGYVPLAVWHVTSLEWIALVAMVGQFTFGLATSVYMLCLMRGVSGGKHPMSFFAIGTAVMALGMLVFGSISGSMQQALGYSGFFVWIVALSLAIIAIVVFYQYDEK